MLGAMALPRKKPATYDDVLAAPAHSSRSSSTMS
jgi:hypothetical protein